MKLGMAGPRVRCVVGFRIQTEFISIKDAYRTTAVIFAVMAIGTEISNDAALSATVSVAACNHARRTA